MDSLTNGHDLKDAYNRKSSRSYRKGDEIALASQNIIHRCKILKELSSSFDQKINVIDLGCGTGRYFHCLQNTARLTGIDISPHMLHGAKNPIKKKEITAEKIELICTDIFDVALPAESYDFIYSIGVLGEYTPFNAEICDRFYELLKFGGKVFFTIVDLNAKINSLSKLDKISEIIYHSTPKFLRSFYFKFQFLYPLQNVELEQKRLKNYLKLSELKIIMQQSKFNKYNIMRYYSQSRYWRGAHFECIAQK